MRYVPILANADLVRRDVEMASRSVPSFAWVWDHYLHDDADNDWIEEFQFAGRGKTEAEALREGEELIRELYEDALDRIDSLAGADCWRQMHLPPETDPVTLDPLGRYWAYNVEGAETKWGTLVGRRDTPSRNVLYRARIDLDRVDMTGTVLANANPLHGLYEQEVRFMPGADIFVYDVAASQRSGTGPFETLPINDWRRA